MLLLTMLAHFVPYLWTFRSLSVRIVVEQSEQHGDEHTHMYVVAGDAEDSKQWQNGLHSGESSRTASEVNHQRPKQQKGAYSRLPDTSVVITVASKPRQLDDFSRVHSVNA